MNRKSEKGKISFDRMDNDFVFVKIINVYYNRELVTFMLQKGYLFYLTGNMDLVQLIQKKTG